MRGKWCIVLALVICLVAGTANLFAGGSNESEAAGDEKIVFRFALQQGQDHPLTKGIQRFNELLTERSGGRLSFQLYYSGVLGSKASTIQGLQTGTIDAAMLMGGVVADYGAPLLKVFCLPYLFDSLDHARAFEKSENGRALFDYIQEAGTRIVCLGAYQESARNYFFVDKDVQKPSDMQGLLIRCQEGAVYYDAIEALGATAQSVDFSELFTALQSGIVDGAEQPLSGFVTNAYPEIAKYYILDQHEISPNLILFSEPVWNKLSADDQALIQECFDETVPYFEEISDAADADYMQQILDAGVKVTEVNVSEWKDACASVYDEYGDEYAEIIAQIDAMR